MAESQVLAKLRDISLPEPVGWWPMAPGWYFLILAGLVVLAFTFYRAHRYRMNGRAKRQALQLLESYLQEYKDIRNSQLSSARVSELLRRVALVYFPREQVASLQGEDWLRFLNNTVKGVNFDAVRHCLLESPYQPAKNISLEPLFICAKAWIKQRSVPCLN